MGNNIKGSRLKNKGLNIVLEEIIKKKKKDLAKQKQEISLSELKEFVSNLGIVQGEFKKAISDTPKISLIAEIKLASPADPQFGPTVEIMDQAKIYEDAGADCISYITEKYFFKGDVASIIKIAAKVKLPIIQKDFVIDEYQIYEAKIVGSSALLLIARLLDGKKLGEFVDLCKSFGIEPVVEINDQKDLDKALSTTTNVVAVNARDLTTFQIDVDKACELLKRIPDKFIKLGFSGINSTSEVEKYKKAGAKGVLVGTSLMQSENAESFIKSLKNI
jgi:indole-3-glycerol phosphate synthase